MRRLTALLLLLAACTSSERGGSVDSRLPTPPVVDEVQPEPAAPVVAQATYWQWDERIADENRWPALPPEIAGARGTYRLSGEGPLVLTLHHPGGRKTFVRELPDSQHHDAGAMAIDGDAVYVAHHAASATGTTLTRIDGRTGEIVWSTKLVGAGPLGHSKYRNRVQIDVVDHRPVVYGNESYGKYTEIVDPARGRTLAHGVPLAALADADWRFDRDLMAAPPPQPSSFATDGGRFVIVEPADPHDPAELRRESDRGAIEWSVPLTAWNGCGRTAMLEIGDTLWAVRWCSAASGATVVGVHRERGTLVTQRALRSLPNVVHSVYRAEVELREIDGHLVVFGAELGGRYIEALDPKTGVTVVSRTFR